MKSYYFDNSATSYPKPEIVYDKVNYAIRELNANPGRGAYKKSVDVSREIYSVREKISDFFNLKNPLNVAFTSNATESLNFAIKGAVKENSHVITSYFEHNSVLRPLYCLRDEKNVKVSFIKTYEELESKINEETTTVIINHISNVNGTVQNLEEIGKICKKYNLLLIVDGSQSAGYKEIDMEKQNIDILCLTGHKSLFGIQGIGAICIKNGLDIVPILEGGTGSFSKYERQPKQMPELLEAGTVNTPGIISLGAGIDFINKVGRENIENHENELIDYFIKKIEDLDKIKIYKSITENQGPVISINIDGVDAGEVATLLDEEFGIMCRPGFHCAPIAHKTIGSYETGTVRFSFGYFNKKEDIDYLIKAIEVIKNEL